ncbi:LysE family transporter [Brevibacillus laterosporus]|uniref:LysE family transporter n=1 Tax=Brevibacillus laterosporus TaxID=1465 RepID=UPI0003B1884E|nr:LysE family transporter [Brevibacillus laterosporus]ERM18186.1 amino acid transporter LysE [Brevibacillus laterosporus PE36]
MPFLSMLLYAFISSFTPGPNNIMAMLFANKYGFKQTLRFCLGVGAGFFVIIVMSCYFNLVLKNFIPKIELIMSILGAAYMIYLAIKIITSTNHDQDTDRDKSNSFLAGMLLQFVNPKGILYGITVISTFIIPYHTLHLCLLYNSLLLAFIGFMGTFSWSVFGSIFKTVLSKYRNQCNVVMALLLLYSAISILFI